MSMSSAVFFCIRSLRLSCNAAGSPRLSVVRKILYFLIRVQSIGYADFLVYDIMILWHTKMELLVYGTLGCVTVVASILIFK